MLLSESEDWVSKQLAAKEKEALKQQQQSTSGSRKQSSTSPPRKQPTKPKTPVPPVVEVKQEVPVPEPEPEPQQQHVATVAVFKEEPPSSQESILPASTASESERGDSTTEISSVSGSSLVPESVSGTSIATTSETTTTTESTTSVTAEYSSSIVSQTDSGMLSHSAEQIHSEQEEEEREVVTSQVLLAPPEDVPVKAEVAATPSKEQLVEQKSSQLCDTTSSEDVLDLYVTNQDREPEFSYDTDESTEKRDWKNEGKPGLLDGKASSTSQHSGPPPPLLQHPNRPPLSNRPNNFKHSGDSSGGSSGDQMPHFMQQQPPGMGMPPGPHPNFGGPFRGGMRPRFPPRPGFPGDMNNYRNNRMNFPMGGRPPFPPRGPPFDHMLRPGMIHPGDRPPFGGGGPRMGPMYRPNGPGGGPPLLHRGAMPPGGPPQGPGPMGAMPPHQPPLLSFEAGPLAAAAVPAIPATPVLPRKVLINPNFKGGVEAATSEYPLDDSTERQIIILPPSTIQQVN